MPADRILVLLVLLASHRVAFAQDERPQPEAVEFVDPLPHLLRNDAVRGELKLNPQQLEQLDAWLAANNDQLFVLRDASRERGGAAWNELAGELHTAFNSSLSAQQRTRLEQLVRQAQGLNYLRLSTTAKQLKLTSSQRSKMQDTFKSAETELAEVRGLTAKQPQEAAGRYKKAQEQLRADIVNILSDAQEKQFAQLVGKPFDMSQVEPMAGRAPELKGITAWINTEPLKLADLHGRVVVLHFYAFGCINCIHNYPHYKQWLRELPADQVTIVGIHTPETNTERDVEQVRAAAARDSLSFPIAVDGSAETWKAWNNNIWPAVYVIDREGYVRFWWYGELDWQGAGGQHVARRKVEELLNAGPAPGASDEEDSD